MTVRMADHSKATGLDSGAIYYEVNPNIILLLRTFNVLVLLMVIISFVFCLVQGHENETFYLLACNTIISTLIGIVVNWWYRRGDLGAEKYWYIFIVGAVILFQCITTDIFVFNVKSTSEATSTTRTTFHPTGTFTWVTLNTSTLKPPPITPGVFRVNRDMPLWT